MTREEQFKETVKKRGNWVRMPAAVARAVLDDYYASRSGREAPEHIAFVELMYYADLGKVKPIRYYAARWNWSRRRVHTLFKEWGLVAGQNRDKTGTKAGQNRDRKRPSRNRRSDSRDKTGTKPGQKRDKSGTVYPDSDTDSEDITTTSSVKTQREWVEVIYQAYPRKAGTKKAKESIAKVLKDGVDPEWLRERTEKFCAIWQPRLRGDPDGKRFCPMPATWFNQGRYEDSEDEWKVVAEFDRYSRRTEGPKPNFARL